MIDQRRRQSEVRVDDGHVQRAGPVGRDVVDVGSVSQQDLRRLEAIVAHGEEEARPAGLRFRIDFRAGLDQQSAAAALPADAAHINAVCPLIGSLRVHVGTVSEQHFHRRHAVR